MGISLHPPFTLVPIPLRMTAASPILVAVPVGAPGARILEANPNRAGFSIYNNSSNTIYIQFKGPMVGGSNVHQIAAYTSWYGPFNGTVWQGEIWAMRNSGSGNAVIYEFEV